MAGDLPPPERPPELLYHRWARQRPAARHPLAAVIAWLILAIVMVGLAGLFILVVRWFVDVVT